MTDVNANDGAAAAAIGDSGITTVVTESTNHNASETTIPIQSENSAVEYVRMCVVDTYENVVEERTTVRKYAEVCNEPMQAPREDDLELLYNAGYDSNGQSAPPIIGETPDEYCEEEIHSVDDSAEGTRDSGMLELQNQQL